MILDYLIKNKTKKPKKQKTKKPKNQKYVMI
jgi:hypothetical protein